MTDTVIYDGVKYRLPFSGLLRPLTKFERLDLLTSLRVDGPISPVTTYDLGDDGPPGVIDGANRLVLCAGNRISGLSFINKGKIPETAARRMAYDLNLARRHLSADEQQDARRERVARVAEKRAAGKSIRTIAEEEGVSKSQIERDLDSGVPGGTPDEVQGKDGKVYKKPQPTEPASLSVGQSSNGTGVTVTPTVEVEQVDAQTEDVGILITPASASECRDVLTQMHKQLGKFQEQLSGLMAHEQFAAQIRQVAESCDCKVWTDGQIQGDRAWGSVRYGVAKYTADPLDKLLGFIGTLKVMFDRIDSRPVQASGPAEDPYAFGQEMRGDDRDIDI